MEASLAGSDEKLRIFKITLVMSAFLSMIFLDQTGVAVTLDSIQKQYTLSNSSVSWIMNAYMLGLSATLLMFARLSDSIGIRRLFCIGISVFMLASIGCATASSGPWIIICRALQGIGASMGYSTYLLIFNHQVPASDRGRVLGVSASFGAIFLAFGPLIGGFFSQIISWRYLFWLNVPICLACLKFTFDSCSKDVNIHNEHFPDKFGLLTYLFGVVGAVVFLMEGSAIGWGNPWNILAIAISIFGFSVFFWHEARHHAPLLEVGLLKNKVFTASVVILFGNYACVTSIAFWALWLQQVMGYSPLIAGLALLPAGVPYMFSSKLGGALYDKRGPRLPLFVGSVLFLIGFVEMALVAPLMQYGWFMLGMLMVGLGWGFVRPCAILSGLNSVPAPQKSMATGVISTMRQLGAAFGFALVYAVISTYENHFINKIIQDNHLDVTTQQIRSLISSHQTNFFIILLGQF
jgi:EmrB/QacA subfamily drug resistance transporter